MSNIYSTAILGLRVDTKEFSKNIQDVDKTTLSSLEAMRLSAANFEGKWADLTAGIKDTKRIISGILVSRGFYALMEGFTTVASSVLEFSKNMETAAISVSYFVDGADKAAKSMAYLRELNTFAARTPFSTESALSLSKYIQAMGMSINVTKSFLSVITDTAAATGATTENLQRITLALGQMLTKGRLANEEIRQLANANVPIYDILEEELNLTGNQISKIGNYWVSADKAVEAILRGLEKRYSGAADRVADTVTGMLDTVVDDSKIIAQQAGAGLYAGFEKSLGKVRNVLDEYRDYVTQFGSAALFNHIAKEIDPSGQFETWILTTVGNLKQLGSSLSSAYQSALPLIGLFGRSFATSLNLGLVVLTSFTTVVDDTLKSLNKMGITTGQVGKALSTLYIGYQASKWMITLGESAFLVTTRMYETASSIAAILPASVAAYSGLAQITIGLASAAAAALSLYYIISNLSGFAGLDLDSAGNSSDYAAQLDAYNAAMDEYNKKIAKYQSQYQEPYTEISDDKSDAIDAINDVSKASSGAADKAKKDWTASFDEVYTIPKDADAGGGSGSTTTQPDLGDLLNIPAIKFPKIDTDELKQPTFDLDKVFKGSLFDANDDMSDRLKKMLPFAITYGVMSAALGFAKGAGKRILDERAAKAAANSTVGSTTKRFVSVLDDSTSLGIKATDSLQKISKLDEFIAKDVSALHEITDEHTGLLKEGANSKDAASIVAHLDASTKEYTELLKSYNEIRAAQGLAPSAESANLADAISISNIHHTRELFAKIEEIKKAISESTDAVFISLKQMQLSDIAKELKQFSRSVYIADGSMFLQVNDLARQLTITSEAFRTAIDRLITGKSSQAAITVGTGTRTVDQILEVKKQAKQLHEIYDRLIALSDNSNTFIDEAAQETYAVIDAAANGYNKFDKLLDKYATDYERFDKLLAIKTSRKAAGVSTEAIDAQLNELRSTIAKSYDAIKMISDQLRESSSEAIAIAQEQADIMAGRAAAAARADELDTIARKEALALQRKQLQEAIKARQALIPYATINEQSIAYNRLLSNKYGSPEAYALNNAAAASLTGTSKTGLDEAYSAIRKYMRQADKYMSNILLAVNTGNERSKENIAEVEKLNQLRYDFTEYLNDTADQYKLTVKDLLDNAAFRARKGGQPVDTIIARIYDGTVSGLSNIAAVTAKQNTRLADIGNALYTVIADSKLSTTKPSSTFPLQLSKDVKDIVQLSSDSALTSSKILTASRGIGDFMQTVPGILLSQNNMLDHIAEVTTSVSEELGYAAEQGILMEHVILNAANAKYDKDVIAYKKGGYTDTSKAAFNAQIDSVAELKNAFGNVIETINNDVKVKGANALDILLKDAKQLSTDVYEIADDAFRKVSAENWAEGYLASQALNTTLGVKPDNGVISSGALVFNRDFDFSAVEPQMTAQWQKMMSQSLGNVIDSETLGGKIFSLDNISKYTKATGKLADDYFNNVIAPLFETWHEGSIILDASPIRHAVTQFIVRYTSEAAKNLDVKGTSETTAALGELLHSVKEKDKLLPLIKQYVRITDENYTAIKGFQSVISTLGEVDKELVALPNSIMQLLDATRKLNTKLTESEKFTSAEMHKLVKWFEEGYATLNITKLPSVKKIMTQLGDMQTAIDAAASIEYSDALKNGTKLNKTQIPVSVKGFAPIESPVSALSVNESAKYIASTIKHSIDTGILSVTKDSVDTVNRLIKYLSPVTIVPELLEDTTKTLEGRLANIIVDLETTGLYPSIGNGKVSYPLPIQASVYNRTSGEVAEKYVNYGPNNARYAGMYLNATKRTDVTLDEIVTKMDKGLADEHALFNWVKAKAGGQPISGYNAVNMGERAGGGFDLRLIEHYMGEDFIKVTDDVMTVLTDMIKASVLNKTYTFKLGQAAAMLGISVDGLHDAANDAVVTGKVADKLLTDTLSEVLDYAATQGKITKVQLIEAGKLLSTANDVSKITDTVDSAAAEIKDTIQEATKATVETAQETTKTVTETAKSMDIDKLFNKASGSLLDTDELVKEFQKIAFNPSETYKVYSEESEIYASNATVTGEKLTEKQASGSEAFARRAIYSEAGDLVWTPYINKAVSKGADILDDLFAKSGDELAAVISEYIRAGNIKRTADTIASIIIDEAKGSVSKVAADKFGSLLSGMLYDTGMSSASEIKDLTEIAINRGFNGTDMATGLNKALVGGFDRILDEVAAAKNVDAGAADFSKGMDEFFSDVSDDAFKAYQETASGAFTSAADSLIKEIDDLTKGDIAPKALQRMKDKLVDEIGDGLDISAQDFARYVRSASNELGPKVSKAYGDVINTATNNAVKSIDDTLTNAIKDMTPELKVSDEIASVVADGADALAEDVTASIFKSVGKVNWGKVILGGSVTSLGALDVASLGVDLAYSIKEAKSLNSDIANQIVAASKNDVQLADAINDLEKHGMTLTDYIASQKLSKDAFDSFFTEIGVTLSGGLASTIAAVLDASLLASAGAAGVVGGLGSLAYEAGGGNTFGNKYGKDIENLIRNDNLYKQALTGILGKSDTTDNATVAQQQEARKLADASYAVLIGNVMDTVHKNNFFNSGKVYDIAYGAASEQGSDRNFARINALKEQTATGEANRVLRMAQALGQITDTFGVEHKSAYSNQLISGDNLTKAIEQLTKVTGTKYTKITDKHGDISYTTNAAKPTKDNTITSLTASDVSSMQAAMDYIFQGAHYSSDTAQEFLSSLDETTKSMLRQSTRYGKYIEALDVMPQFLTTYNEKNNTRYTMDQLMSDDQLMGSFQNLLLTMQDDYTKELETKLKINSTLPYQENDNILKGNASINMYGATLGSTAQKAIDALNALGISFKEGSYTVDTALQGTLTNSFVTVSTDVDKLKEHLAAWTIDTSKLTNFDFAHIALSTKDTEILASAGIQINSDGTVTFAKAQDEGKTGSMRTNMLTTDQISKYVNDTLVSKGFTLDYDNHTMSLDKSKIMSEASGAMFKMPTDFSTDTAQKVKDALGNIGNLMDSGYFELTDKAILGGKKTIEGYVEGLYGANKIDPELKRALSDIDTKIKAGVAEYSDGIILPSPIPKDWLTGPLEDAFKAAGVTFTTYDDQFVMQVSELGDHLKAGINKVDAKDWLSLDDSLRGALSDLGVKVTDEFGDSIDNIHDITKLKTSQVLVDLSGTLDKGIDDIVSLFLNQPDEWANIPDTFKQYLEQAGIVTQDGMIKLNAIMSGKLVETANGWATSMSALSDSTKTALTNLGIDTSKGLLDVCNIVNSDQFDMGTLLDGQIAVPFKQLPAEIQEALIGKAGSTKAELQNSFVVLDATTEAGLAGLVAALGSKDDEVSSEAAQLGKVVGQAFTKALQENTNFEIIQQQLAHETGSRGIFYGHDTAARQGEFTSQITGYTYYPQYNTAGTLVGYTYIDGTGKKKLISKSQLPYKAKGGLAAGNILEGEEGKELAIFPDGTMKMLGINGPEIANVPKGTQIISNDDTKDLMKYVPNLDNTKVKKYATGTDSTVNVTNTNEYAGLSDVLDEAVTYSLSIYDGPLYKLVSGHTLLITEQLKESNAWLNALNNTVVTSTNSITDILSNLSLSSGSSYSSSSSSSASGTISSQIAAANGSTSGIDAIVNANKDTILKAVTDIADAGKAWTAAKAAGDTDAMTAAHDKAVAARESVGLSGGGANGSDFSKDTAELVSLMTKLVGYVTDGNTTALNGYFDDLAKTVEARNATITYDSGVAATDTATATPSKVNFADAFKDLPAGSIGFTQATLDYIQEEVTRAVDLYNAAESDAQRTAATDVAKKAAEIIGYFASSTDTAETIRTVIEDVLKNISGAAAGGMISKDSIYRAGEFGHLETVIPLERPDILTKVGTTIADNIPANTLARVANAAGRQNAGVSVSAQSYVSPEDTANQAAQHILERVLPAIVANKQTDPDNKRPLYVGMLVADSRSLRELKKKMDIIELENNRR